jgi:hypothetical protein
VSQAWILEMKFRLRLEEREREGGDGERERIFFKKIGRSNFKGEDTNVKKKKRKKGIIKYVFGRSK